MSQQIERQVLQECIKTAGREVLRIAREGFETDHKANQDPVTTADLVADAILRETLTGEFPDTAWLSEETRDDPARLKCERVWIVDPIDGTKEFVAGIPEFSISVALVAEGVPVLGAVYNPSTDELFLAAAGWGATLNGQAIRAEHAPASRPVLLASRSEIKRGEFERFEPFAEVRPMGSIAYKLARVAANYGDATFSLGPKNEWDIAAGVLLVNEAGGRATDLAGEEFRFNQPDTLTNGILAAASGAYEPVVEMIRRVTGR